MRRIHKIAFTILFILISSLNAGIFELYGTGAYGTDYSASAFGRGGISTAYTDTLSGSTNPAQLAHVQFTELEAGLNTRFSYISDFGYNESSVRFDYANLMIPVGRKGGLQLGIHPISSARAEYQINTSYITEIIETIGDIYSLSLGFGYQIASRIYGGIAFELITGGYTLSNEILFSNDAYYSSEKYFSKGIDGRRLTLGTVVDLNNLTIGVRYAHPYRMKYKTLEYNSYSEYVYNEPVDTTLTHHIIIPRELSAGMAMKIGRRHYLMSDYTLRYLQDASLLKSFNPINPDHTSSSSHHLAAGYERRGAVGLFVPFFQSLTYRTGVFYDKQGLGTDFQRYGISAGLGIPFNNFKSRIDVGLHYGLNSGDIFENIEMNESFFQIKISVNSIERWFNTRGKYR
jgi:hypothetical protein